jgi:MFS family permease
MSSSLLVLLLSLLLGLQPITTDLYLPALPGLTRDLGASMAQAQLTLSALLLAFGLSQLVWGPLSDRFGRRPVLLAGALAYLLASLASAAANSIESLIVWRTLQGIAMGAGVMCARCGARPVCARAGRQRHVQGPQRSGRFCQSGCSRGRPAQQLVGLACDAAGTGRVWRLHAGAAGLAF